MTIRSPNRNARASKRSSETSPALPDQERAAAVRADERLGVVDWFTPPQGSTRWTFDAPSGPLAVVSTGPADGVPVVLIPGATGSKEDFLLVTLQLVKAGFHVVAYDLAGQYESCKAGPATGGRYDDELNVHDLLALLRRTGAAHVLGYSYAGTVAAITAIRHPELVRSLTLMSTPPLTGQSFRGIKIIGRFASLATPHAAAALMIWGVRWNLNHATKQRARFARYRFALTRRTSVDDIMRAMMHTPEFHADARALRVRKLVVAGTHDLWPTSQQRAFAIAIGAEAVFYDTGHSPCETTPHELALDLIRLYTPDAA